MHTIKTITDKDVGIDEAVPTSYRERNASRAIVFDEGRNIALLYSTKNKYHKLPGGGVEEGEDIEAALRRELFEEIGCKVENIQGLAIIEEYRNKFALHQFSHCFTADLLGEKGTPHLEENELEEGFVTEWLDLDTAVLKLESEKSVEDYQGKFIQMRDLAFLLEAKKVSV